MIFLLFSLSFYLISNDNNQSRQKFVFSATLMLQPNNDNEKKKQKKKKEDNQDKLGLFTINSIFSFHFIDIYIQFF